MGSERMNQVPFALPLLEVVAGVIWRHGRFLAARRVEGRELGGFWEFPGGKIEPGESPREALSRELAEELGIGVREAAFWQFVEHPAPERGLRIGLHFFQVSSFSGSPCPREGQFLCWLSPGDAAGLAFLPADATVLGQLLEEAR